MSKTRTTKTAIRTNYKKVVNVSYCGLQHLLKFQSPAYYTTRAEGWGLDVYTVGDVAICTGYDTISGAKSVPYSVYNKYDNMAVELCNSINDYEALYNALDCLLYDFIAEAV